MRRLMMGGAVLMLATSGCVGLIVDNVRKSPVSNAARFARATRATNVARKVWPGSLPGRVLIVNGIYSVNGNSDVLFNAADNYYYKLTFGTWYRSPMRQGGWMKIGNLPDAFKSIPKTHARYKMIKNMPFKK